MPKKKTGARKKAEKQKERQKEIRTSSEARSLVQQPCNSMMVSVQSMYWHTQCLHTPLVSESINYVPSQGM